MRDFNSRRLWLTIDEIGSLNMLEMKEKGLCFGNLEEDELNSKLKPRNTVIKSEDNGQKHHISALALAL